MNRRRTRELTHTCGKERPSDVKKATMGTWKRRKLRKHVGCELCAKEYQDSLRRG